MERFGYGTTPVPDRAGTHGGDVHRLRHGQRREQVGDQRAQPGRCPVAERSALALAQPGRRRDVEGVRPRMREPARAPVVHDRGEALVAAGEVRRAQVDRAPVEAARREPPAGHASAVEDLHVDAGGLQRPRARSTRDAGTHDRDRHGAESAAAGPPPPVLGCRRPAAPEEPAISSRRRPPARPTGAPSPAATPKPTSATLPTHPA